MNLIENARYKTFNRVTNLNSLHIRFRNLSIFKALQQDASIWA